MYKALGVTVLLSVMFVLAHRSAKADESTGTSKGTTLIQLGCGGNGGILVGPVTTYLYSGNIPCSINDNGVFPPTPLPSGTLYNLRVALVAGTFDTTPQKYRIRLFTNGGRTAGMVCYATVGIGTPSCDDLTDTIGINAGDTVYATVEVPDSKSNLYGATVTVEEAIVE